MYQGVYQCIKDRSVSQTFQLRCRFPRLPRLHDHMTQRDHHGGVGQMQGGFVRLEVLFHEFVHGDSSIVVFDDKARV